MQGRKPNLDNVVQHPNQNERVLDYQEPGEQDVERAAELKPDLTGLASEYWDRIAPQLVMLGRLKPIFVDALEDYCVIRARLKNAQEYLDEKEWVYVTEGRNGMQYKARPQVAQLNDDWRKFRSLVGEFGLAPSSERSFNAGGQLDLFDDGLGSL